MATAKIRPLYCGNFEYDARQPEIERLFQEYGRVDRVDMKTGFSFIYMDDERDAKDAIRHLDNMEFGRQRRRLCVEWAKQGDGAIRRREDARRSNTKLRPSKTLFVVNFDPIDTRVRDLERHFEPYGRLVRVQIRKNFGFVQYESQEEATKALECTNMSKVMDRVITVEYAAREDGEPSFGGRGRSPGRYRAREDGEPPFGGRGRSPGRYRGREDGEPSSGGRGGSPGRYKAREDGEPAFGGRGASPGRYRPREDGEPPSNGRSGIPGRSRTHAPIRGASDSPPPYIRGRSRTPTPPRGREPNRSPPARSA